MVNMRIFKTILECAFDLNVLYFDTKVHRFYSNKDGHSFIHKCNINTNDGGLHITLHEGHFKENKYINVEVKTTIKSHSKEDILELVKSQLGIEAFLGYDDYKDYSYECTLIK